MRRKGRRKKKDTSWPEEVILYQVWNPWLKPGNEQSIRKTFVRGGFFIISQWVSAIHGHNLPNWATKPDIVLWLKDMQVSSISFYASNVLCLRWAHLLCWVTTATSREPSKMPLTNVHKQRKSKSRKLQLLDWQISCPSGTWKIYMPKSDIRGLSCTILPYYHRLCFVSPFFSKKMPQYELHFAGYLGRCYIMLRSL